MEIWKDIEGYEGKYQVSNKGNVRRLNLLTPKCGNTGRLSVQLTNSQGETKYKLIHRLVGQAFIPNPDRLPQINHIDENPRNNQAGNLEWCTQEYNLECYWSKRRKPKEGKTRVNNQYPQKVIQTTKSGEFVTEWENIAAIHRETGWNSFSITECCKGNRHTAYGYKWHFA